MRFDGDRERGGTCSAYWRGAESGALEWAVRWGLVEGETGTRRLASCAQGRMAGHIAPSASPGELELLACWGAFIVLVDDGFDRGREPASSANVRAVLEPLVAVLDGAGTTVSTPEVLALRDLRQRTLVGAVPGWAARLAAAYRSFAEATVEEARWRESGYLPTLAEYLELRRRTITVAPLLLVAERLAAAWPALEELHDVCADVVAWTNDLIDAGSQEPGQISLVDVLARERGLGRGEAAAQARAMIEDRLDDFDTAAARLADAELWPGTDRERVEAVRTFMAGSVAWQGESRRYRAELPSQHTLPDPAADPVEQAAIRLERRLALAVAPGGAIPDRCAGRVLESALLLALLRKLPAHHSAQRQLADWLQERRKDADPVDALLIDACLRPHLLPAEAADAATPFTRSLGRFTGPRGRLKRSMLHTVLHLLGGLRLTADDLPDRAIGDTMSAFAHVNLSAVRTIAAHATGRPHHVAPDERVALETLLDQESDRLLWESNATTHLLGLHAVHTYQPAHPLLEQATAGLLQARAADGSMPFLDSQDVWLSAVGGLAFLARPALRRYTARMGAFVAARQAEDGGWPYATGIRQTDVDTACRAMEFLHALDPHRYRARLRRGAAYLTATAGPDGGFPTWLRGDTPDLDMTAGAIIALAPLGPDHHPAVAAATHFVLDAQHDDGTWDPSWSLSEASVMLRAVDALHAARHVPGTDHERIAAATARAAARLTTTQQADGGWGRTPDDDSDALSTAQALPVAARHCPPHVAAAATAHLLTRQDEAGRFPAPPDQVGPRPMPFDFPVLADLHALAALTRTRAAP
ncbi:prenyltransferase/squalene oxidase repeat-containing protein [Kitasatospora purpeofusca]|uniref:terpene synthase family protein n=1 Tax=Kitasatospora purpeofusca TaxID=67352 RepID=UPI0035DF2E4D